MLQLRSLPGDEFLSSDADADEAYLEMAKQFRFDVLGTVAGDEPDKCLAEFREDMGTLHDERWKALTWRRPDKESSPCWWLINPCDQDKSQPPKLLSRSLATLRLELQQQPQPQIQRFLHDSDEPSEELLCEIGMCSRTIRVCYCTTSQHPKSFSNKYESLKKS